MKKWIALLSLLSLVLSLALTGCRPGSDELFYFNPDRYDVIDLGSYDRTYYSSIKAIENATKLLPQGIIAKCTVIGGSLNKIQEQSEDVQTGTNHVLTPVRIDAVYYAGEAAHITEGDVCYLYEDYFYVTEKTPKLLDYYGRNTVLVREYDPVIAADTYIIFAQQKTDREEQYLQEKTFPIVPVSGSEAIFPIAYNWDDVQKYAGIANHSYYTTWADIMESYCDIIVPGAPPQMGDETGPADDGTLTQEELDAFQELFAFHGDSDSNWYNYALKSTYETAADVDLFELFYSAPWEDPQLTQEEKDFLTKNGMLLDTGLVHEYPVEMMDEVLQKYFGITLEQTNGVGLDKLIYNPDTDSYYHMHGDFEASYCTITEGRRQGDGTILLCYTTGTQDTGKVTLQPKEDGSYQILSNVLTEEEQGDTQVEGVFPPVSQPAIKDSGDYFIYTTDPDDYDYFAYYLQLDTSQCREGLLYRYYRDTKELILVVDEPVVCVQACGYGYLYVAEADKQTLMWTDAFGEEHIPVYTAQYGDISVVQYYKDYEDSGVGEDDIYTLEGNTYVVRIHNPEWTSEVLFEGAGITSFYYRDIGTESYLVFYTGDTDQTENEYHVHFDTGKIEQFPCKTCLARPDKWSFLTQYRYSHGYGDASEKDVYMKVFWQSEDVCGVYVTVDGYSHSNARQEILISKPVPDEGAEDLLKFTNEYKHATNYFFTFNDGRVPYFHKEGVFYSMEEAYNEGLLTTEDLEFFLKDDWIYDAFYGAG